MTTSVLLVRHGQTESNINGFYMGWSDEDLNKTGVEQVRRLSARLSSLPIDSVYASPLQRVKNSASILAEPHGLAIKALEGLIEVKVGKWQGLHRDEIKRGWPELWHQWQTDPTDCVLPGGESFKQVVQRVIPAFEEIVGSNAGKQLLVVTHEIVVKILAIHVLGAPFGIYRRFDVDNASLSVIRTTAKLTKLITLNDRSHLEG